MADDEEIGRADDRRLDLDTAISAVARYVAAREDKLKELIESTAGKVDERTEQKYSAAIDTVVTALRTGVEKLAVQGPDEPGEPDDHTGDEPDPPAQLGD